MLIVSLCSLPRWQVSVACLGRNAMAILITDDVLMDQAVDSNSELVCIHDSARPLVTAGEVEKV